VRGKSRIPGSNGGIGKTYHKVTRPDPTHLESERINHVGRSEAPARLLRDMDVLALDVDADQAMRPGAADGQGSGALFATAPRPEDHQPPVIVLPLNPLESAQLH
jgi:hypothetical protein